MYITSTCIHPDQWKSFVKFGIKKLPEMISYNLSWIALLSEWNYRSSTKPCNLALHIGLFKIYAWLVLLEYIHVPHINFHPHGSLEKFHKVWNQKVT